MQMSLMYLRHEISLIPSIQQNSTEKILLHNYDMLNKQVTPPSTAI